VIEENYFSPTALEYCTMLPENSGSCKLFAFRNTELVKAATLSCFGAYYQEVLGDLDGTNHRTFATS
jgi:hypothetical protein